MMENIKNKKQKSQNKTKNKGGFTLIEVLVSVIIFVMVIITISQVYITVLRSERIAYALLNAENNIRNNLEVIARSIRVGKNFEILGSGQEILYEYYSEGGWETAHYKFNREDNNLDKEINSAWHSLFDPQTKVDDIHFHLLDSGSDSQKTIVIVLEASTTVKMAENKTYSFNLQTSITPRSLMIEEN